MLAIERYAAAMGPADGPSEVLITRRRTTPLFAAMVNAAAAHVVEQDDVHNGSVFHPAAVVFPPALAVARTLGRSGRDLLTAAVAGYESASASANFSAVRTTRSFTPPAPPAPSPPPSPWAGC